MIHSIPQPGCKALLMAMLTAAHHTIEGRHIGIVTGAQVVRKILDHHRIKVAHHSLTTVS
jgi:hypothetical protein